jgi:hypothetical protein
MPRTGRPRTYDPARVATPAERQARARLKRRQAPVVLGPCTLYCGDAYALLPTLGRVAACITDPPYGTGALRGGHAAGEFKARHTKEAWDVWRTDWLGLVTADTFAVFCPERHLHDLLGGTGRRHLRHWVKSNPRPGQGGLDAPSVDPIVIWPRVRYSHGPAHLTVYNGETPHPYGKPLALMTWLVRDLTRPGDLVLDPFMGCGTTGLACLALGRRFIGIEREPHYFHAACHAIGNAAKQGTLVAAS